ncbi:EamA family transporter RarD [Allorhizobium borbori]|uniref:Chloramphenicol-sensitive protein RarD n=1 Tax=Allorhizobium borbori TaxID=485907 RepID=A0A7W6JZZ4_9HYPH|nr:EamA family transporter RarD [Allorhizobium borbori]MBB4102655.1 chloramphenicol-sensitive protein RarD [Allorhizobium borbori]PZU22351.1 MAG: EamA family transporter RarD [Shinella sp.]
MATDAPAAPKNEDSRKGFVLAAAAYLLWGALPFYLKALGHLSPFEVISHRVFWSVPIAGVILAALGQLGELKVALRSPRMLGMAFITASLVSINWGVYVWAISIDRTLDAALGYFINPLFSIFLGAVLLKEKLAPAQIAALGLAAIGVAIMTYATGALPWIGLILTLSWGAYAFLRKALPIGANQGFFLEVALLSPFALGYILWLTATGQGHFMQGVPLDSVLLGSAGLATAIPLMLYANGAKLLRLSTIAIMQYITPSLLFLVAVFAFNEPMNPLKLSAFIFIWAALIVYSWSMMMRAKA